VKTIIDALMQGTAWPSSAFILSYDEAGGMYDHVPPVTLPKPDSIAPILLSTDAPGDFTLSGFRVPFILISPWAKRHFVSHVNRDFTSILRLIEARFNLNPLTARDSAADNMTEFFDFNAPPNLTPPALPDQPTNGTCLFSMEKAPGH
jgi:phospholipase C